ncbi:MAG: ABC transporter ATP-binding protein, partial [Nitrospirae bacterium CG_4_9_14_3_um_filter_51_5]
MPEARVQSLHRIFAKDLKKSYKGRQVVRGVSLELLGGEVVGLLGPNGAGKTTIFDMVVGLCQPDHGEIFLNNDEITTLPMYKRARRGIGYLPQEASIFRRLSVEDNVLAVLETLDLPTSTRKARLDELLEELDLTR